METAIALGTFDGVHIGHKSVLQQTEGYNSVAITFKVPPKLSLAQSAQLLMQPERRFECLKKMGIQKVCVLDFEKVQKMSAEDFLEHIKQEYNPTLVVCGFNYRFGFGTSGDTVLLEKYCNENGIRFFCAKPVTVEGKVVSSSQIRTLIANGKIKEANALMCEPFSFTATVIKGDQRGRTLGFPTVNQHYPQELVTPKFGVYETEAEVGGKIYPAITNIGIRPTYQTDTVGCETHIRNFSNNLYGKDLTIRLIRFIREEKKFSSKQKLAEAISKDIEQLFGK